MLLSCLLTFSFCSQTKRIEKANAIFDAAQYFKAKDKYEKLYAKMSDKEQKAQIAFKIAECYRNLNILNKQVTWYKKALKTKTPEPIISFHLANAYRMQELYDDAAREYENYLKISPDNAQAKNGLESCKIAAEWKKNPTRYTVELVKELNSRDNDFCPQYARPEYNEIYFTSSREASKGAKFNDVSGQNFTDIFQSFIDRKGKWSEPNVIKGDINSEFDEGAVSFAPKMRTIYFTRCPIEKGKNLGCKIYTANRTEDGWSKPEAIEIFKDSSLSVGHPAISPDECTLYFVANNIEGGLGGRDIWMVNRNNKTRPWGKPVNLGPEINTSGDEMFPYVREDGTLYFSSNGHIGMGGLDIFKAKKNDENKWVVENLKSPINSAGDDFGITFQGKEEKGLFTSNRAGGKGGDDIYSFTLPPIVFKVSGIVKNEATGAPIEGALVRLIGSDGSQFEKNTAADGVYKFDLKSNTDYLILATKELYLSGKAKQTTKGLNGDKALTADINLSQIILKESRELQNIEYDFNRTDLRPESMVTLDKLVELMTDNANITIELGSHTDYKGDSLYNMTLSLGRAQSVVHYLVTAGIDSLRMNAVGYGKGIPYTIKKKDVDKYSFLKEGTILKEDYIKTLTAEQQEICNQINRRTEFKILSTTYVPKTKPDADKNKIKTAPTDADKNK